MIEAAEEYLPPEKGMKDAYLKVRAMHPESTGRLADVQAMEEDTAPQITRDYLLAGVAYFANRGHDAQMQEIGATAWHALQQRSIEVVFADKVQPKAVELGVPVHLAYKYLDGEPHVLFVTVILI